MALTLKRTTKNTVVGRSFSIDIVQESRRIASARRDRSLGGAFDRLECG